MQTEHSAKNFVNLRVLGVLVASFFAMNTKGAKQPCQRHPFGIKKKLYDRFSVKIRGEHIAHIIKERTNGFIGFVDFV